MSRDPGAVTRRPLIGVSASLHDFGDYGGVGVQRPLLLAGALPLTLPQLPDAIEPTLDRLDGIVLAPGRDIEPSRYGQDAHPLPDRPVLAVQWELQEEWRVDRRFLRVFEWFVEAAAAAPAVV